MIKIIPCVVTTDFYKDEKYILSLSETDISFPEIEIKDYSNLDKTIVDTILNSMFVDTQMAKEYVKPRLVAINNEYITNKYGELTKDTLYFLYGCLCPKFYLTDNYFWKSFDFFNNKDLELMKLISHVIEYTI